MSDAELFDEGVGAAPSKTLDELVAAGAKLVEQHSVVTELEQALKSQKSILHEMRTKTMPDAMAEVGIAEFRLTTGEQIKVTSFISGSIPKKEEKRATALQILSEEGGGSLIKSTATIFFEKSDNPSMDTLVDELRKKGLNVEVKTNVHPISLAAFVREKLKNGEVCSWEKMGVFVGQITKVTGSEDG